jgi:glycine/D-amino acid oxidase-like deaminating enzyme
MSTPIHPIVVVGGGLMGSSSAWQLSKSGTKVLLIEQQNFPYTFGSSYGETRISRSLGPKNDVFSDLQQSSVRETQKLIEFLNESDPSTSHSMEDIYVTSPITYIYYQKALEEVNAILDGQSDDHEFASNPDEALDLFGMSIPDSAMVIREYKKYSGTLNPKVLLSKLHAGIRACGNEILFGDRIFSVLKMNGFYELVLSNAKNGEKRIIHAEKIVCAAGAYTGKILHKCAPYIAQLITPKRVFLGFVQIDHKVYSTFSDEQKKRLMEFYPVANINDAFFYSMIDEIDRDGNPILKIGGHLIRREVDSLHKVWQKELSPEEIDWCKQNTADYLTSLKLPVTLSDLHYLKGNTCVYTMTKSEVPYVTNILTADSSPDPNFVIMAGLSGIGAKGSLGYGLIAANILLGKNESTSTSEIATTKALGFDRLIKDLKAL